MGELFEIPMSAMWTVETRGGPRLTPYIERGFQFGRRNAHAVAHLLCELDDKSLFDLLDTIGSDVRDAFFKMLGVLARWQKLRQAGKLPLAARRALLPTLRSKLGTAPDTYGEKAGVLLLWWWGSRAAEHVRRFIASESQTANMPLVQPYVFMEACARATADDRRAMDDTLRSVKLPSEVLSRIFVGLPDALDLDQEAFKSAVVAWIGRTTEQLSLLRPVGTPSRWPSPSSPPDGAQAGEHDFGAKTAQAGNGMAAALPSGVPAPLDQPAEQIPEERVEIEDTSTSTERPEAVARLAQALGAYRDAKVRYDEVLLDSDGERADEAHAALKAAGNDVRGYLDALNALLVEAQGPAVVMPRPVYLDSAAAEPWLQEVAETVRAAEGRSHARADAERTVLIDRLRDASLPIPDELLAARSLRDIERIRAAYQERLTEEEWYHQVVAGKDAPAGMRGSGPHARRALYERLAADHRFTSNTRLLGWLMCDGEIAEELSPSLASDAVLFRLAAGDALPPGTWEWLASLRAGGGLEAVLAALTSSPHAAQLANLSDEHLDMEGLERLHVPVADRLPRELSLRIRLRAASRMPADDRVRRITALALDADLDPRIVRAALAALVDVGRMRPALLLLALALKAECEIEIGDATRCAIQAALVDAADDPEAREVIGVVLSNNPLFLTGDTHDVVVFLYLCAATATRDSYLNLRFTDPESIDEAERAWPILTRRWLNERLIERSAEELEQRREIGREAHALLEKLEHELQRTQIHGWHETKAYKRHFDRELRAAIEALDAGRVLPPLDPDAMYKRARASGQLREPDRSSDAHNEILGYLREQIERIVQLQNLVGDVGDMATLRQLTDHVSTDLKQALLAESARPGTSPVLARIYRRVVEECDGASRGR